MSAASAEAGDDVVLCALPAADPAAPLLELDRDVVDELHRPVDCPRR